MSAIVVAETERLLLRRLTTGDAGFMLALLNDPAFLRFIGDRGVRCEADAARHIETGPMENYARLGYGFYAVQLKACGSLAGLCGLTKRDYFDTPDFGFAFLPAYPGGGYAFESARAAHAHAGELGLSRLLATTRVDNDDSARLLERLGFRFERLMPHPDPALGVELKLFALNHVPSA